MVVEGMDTRYNDVVSSEHPTPKTPKKWKTADHLVKQKELNSLPDYLVNFKMCHDSTYAWQTSRRRTRTFWNKILLPAAEVGVIFGEYLYSYSFVLSVLVIVVREVIGGEEERPPTTTDRVQDATPFDRRSKQQRSQKIHPSACYHLNFVPFFTTQQHHTTQHCIIVWTRLPLRYFSILKTEYNQIQVKQSKSDQIRSNQTKPKLKSIQITK